MTNWSGYKGSARRLGGNVTSASADCVAVPVDVRLRLGSDCRALLGHDGHLIAIALDGTVEIVNVFEARSVCRFHVQGPVTAEPCMHNGVLFVGTRHQVAAYSLPAAMLAASRVRPLWQVAVSGTPIQALTAVDGKLYVTVASADWREVVVIEHASRPPRARTLAGARSVSWTAADPASSEVFFFTEDDGVLLHVANGDLARHSVSLRNVADHPIALLSDSVFAVFGEGRRLYRVSASTGSIEEPLEEDTQLFALTQDVAGEWDGDGVRIDTGGILFARSGVRDSFAPQERAVKGSPVVVQSCVVAVGMDDGRVRIYDLARLPRYDTWRVGGDGGSAITSIAAFDGYLAAGNKEGVVEVRELRARGNA